MMGGEWRFAALKTNVRDAQEVDGRHPAHEGQCPKPITRCRFSFDPVQIPGRRASAPSIACKAKPARLSGATPRISVAPQGFPCLLKESGINLGRVYMANRRIKKPSWKQSAKRNNDGE